MVRLDVNWNLEQKSNDQIEFSLGWGQTGVIGRGLEAQQLLYGKPLQQKQGASWYHAYR